MLQRADAPPGAIHIQLVPTAILAEGLGGADTSWPGTVEIHHRLTRLTADVIFIELFDEGATQHGASIPMHQTRFFQLTQDGHYATGTVHIFHVVFLGGGRHLAQLRHLA